MSDHEGAAVWGDEVVRNLREATAELKADNDRKISPPLLWVRCFCARCMEKDEANRGWVVRRDVAVASSYECPECGRLCDYFNREDA